MSSPLHPNVHAPWSRWSEDQTLNVIAPYFNPFRFRTRRELFNDFAQHASSSKNVRFWPVEIAFGDRPHEVTSASEPTHLQLRTDSVLWYKENQINVGVQHVLRLVPDARYFAYFDADVETNRGDWALEAIHQLQHYDWVQNFAYFTFLSRDHLPIHHHPSFAYVYLEQTDLSNTATARLETFSHVPSETGQQTASPNAVRNVAEALRVPPDAHDTHHGSVPPNAWPPRKQGAAKLQRSLRWPGAPGLSWSWTRRGFDAVGGFMDFCILGSSDWHMALGLTGDEEQRSENFASDGYLNSIGTWQRRAFQQTRGRIGYVKQALVHHWHGDHRNRQYGSRWEILLRNRFDPRYDVVKDAQGLWRYAGNKPHLEREVYRYFLERDDDSTTLYGQVTL